MRWWTSLLAASVLHTTTWALHESDVGVVDWHTKLVGVPLVDSQHTAPVFHEDLILTATSSHVLAALNATDGSIVWRSIHDDEDPILAFKIHDSAVASLSGPGGATFRSYDLSTGDLLLETRLHNPADSRSHNLQEAVIAPAHQSNTLFTLTNGSSVSRIDSQSGEILWKWSSLDSGSPVVYSHILASPDAVYAVGPVKAGAIYTLHVTTLATSNGSLIASVNIPANLAHPRGDFILLAPPATTPAGEVPQGPCLAWLEDASMRVAVLNSVLKGQVLIIPGINYTRIHDVGLASAGQFVAFMDVGNAHVMRYDGTSLRAIWEFVDVAPPRAVAESFFTGSFDKDGQPRIARIYWSQKHGQAIQQTFTPLLAENRGIVTGYTFSFKTNGYGIIRHAAFDGRSSDTQQMTRLLLTTSAGALQLWQHDKLLWSRDEALSTVRVAAFVHLPQSGTLSGLTTASSVEAGFGKHIRQFSQRILQHFYSPNPDPEGTGSTKHSELQGDAFGLRQVIVAATTEGALYGIDSSTGDVLWRRLFGLGWASDRVGGRIVPVKMFVVSEKVRSTGNEAEEEKNRQTVVLVTQRVANNGLVDTVVFEFDPFTGDDTQLAEQAQGSKLKLNAARGSLQGKDVIHGPLVDTFLLPEGNGTVVLLDEFLQVQLYPDTPDTRAVLGRLAPTLHLVLPPRTIPDPRAGPDDRASLVHTQLVGHRLTLNEELSSVHVAYPTWRISLAPGESVRELSPNANAGHIASYGRVLGDRRTLYKYLNPHLRIVVTESVAPLLPTKTCGIYLLDGVKGALVYHVSVAAVEGRCDVRAALVDNWLVYSYYDVGEGEDSTKGWRVVSVEMYEGQKPDDVTRSSELSAYANATMDMTTYEQAYLVRHGITALAPTSTQFGVTLRDLIVATRKHSVQSVPRRFLDPRRPASKPSHAEAEEGLIMYDAVLPDDAGLVLSHNYEVPKVRQIVTAPSRLESTSLVLTLGLDLFLTRVAPSGTFDVLSENFNKAQLVLTITGLVVAVVVVRPIVTRKKLRERWYTHQ
ncbi:hypothetical protein V8B97DRAFT_656854 [Scleroderma yunnanense]